MWVDGAHYRVPMRFGNHGKPGKSPTTKNPCMEKSWNLKKN